MQILTKRRSRGFTLVEVLVSVAIISILTGTIYASVSHMRKKARDVQRYTDLENIQLALRMYKDAYGTYPSTGGGDNWRSVCAGSTTSGQWGYIPYLAPEYIPTLPTDPSGCEQVSPQLGYVYTSDGTDYKLLIDWSAEIGEKCKLGQRFADPLRTTIATDFGVCSIYTPGYAMK